MKNDNMPWLGQLTVSLETWRSYQKAFKQFINEGTRRYMVGLQALYALPDKSVDFRDVSEFLKDEFLLGELAAWEHSQLNIHAHILFPNRADQQARQEVKGHLRSIFLQEVMPLLVVSMLRLDILNICEALDEKQRLDEEGAWEDEEYEWEADLREVLVWGLEGFLRNRALTSAELLIEALQHSKYRPLPQLAEDAQLQERFINRWVDIHNALVTIIMSKIDPETREI